MIKNSGGFIFVVGIWLLFGLVSMGGVAKVCAQGINDTDPVELGGTWLYEFRQCVSAQVEQGIPPAEARQSCSGLLVMAPDPHVEELDVAPSLNTDAVLVGGTWLYEFRQCVSAQVEQGIPPADARPSCSGLLQ